MVGYEIWSTDTEWLKGLILNFWGWNSSCWWWNGLPQFVPGRYLMSRGIFFAGWCSIGSWWDFNWLKMLVIQSTNHFQHIMFKYFPVVFLSASDGALSCMDVILYLCARGLHFFHAAKLFRPPPPSFLKYKFSVNRFAQQSTFYL